MVQTVLRCVFWTACDFCVVVTGAASYITDWVCKNTVISTGAYVSMFFLHWVTGGWIWIWGSLWAISSSISWFCSSKTVSAHSWSIKKWADQQIMGLCSHESLSNCSKEVFLIEHALRRRQKWDRYSEIVFTCLQLLHLNHHPWLSTWIVIDMLHLKCGLDIEFTHTIFGERSWTVLNEIIFENNIN